jgi:hypothetical protein
MQIAFKRAALAGLHACRRSVRFTCFALVRTLGTCAEAPARRRWALVFLLPLLLAPGCRASPPCAATLNDLKALLADQAFPTKWLETTMDDGKPLVLSILEANGSLVLEFVKTGEGLWAQSAGIVCLQGAHLEARFTGDQVRFGPGASWAMRYALANGGRFTLTRLAGRHLQVATTGWSAMFSSGE